MQTADIVSNEKPREKVLQNALQLIPRCDYCIITMETVLKIIQIGNSLGVRLPKSVLVRYRLDKEVRLTETPEGILLCPVETGKLSWQETFEETREESMRAKGGGYPFSDDETAAGRVQEFPDFTDAWDETLSDGLEPETFDGWPR
jgi:hypothetical protein